MSHDNGLGARQRLPPRQRKTTHDNAREARQRLCHPYLARRTAKGALPGMALPCGLYHASTHDNAFVVSFVAFAVPLSRTTKHAFPVLFAVWQDWHQKVIAGICFLYSAVMIRLAYQTLGEREEASGTPSMRKDQHSRRRYRDTGQGT
jgi:hypothetical protein